MACMRAVRCYLRGSKIPEILEGHARSDRMVRFGRRRPAHYSSQESPQMIALHLAFYLALVVVLLDRLPSRRYRYEYGVLHTPRGHLMIFISLCFAA
jgi:hypothetical protein